MCRAARYTDRASHDLANDRRTELEARLAAAWRDHDHAAALDAYRELAGAATACGARSAATAEVPDGQLIELNHHNNIASIDVVITAGGVSIVPGSARAGIDQPPAGP